MRAKSPAVGPQDQNEIFGSANGSKGIFGPATDLHSRMAFRSSLWSIDVAAAVPEAIIMAALMCMHRRERVIHLAFRSDV